MGIITIRTILLVLSLLLFILAAFGVPSRLNLTAAGLAVFIATLLLGPH